MGDPDESSIEIELRSAEEVGKRLVVLAGLIQLAIAAGDADDGDPKATLQEIDDLRDALLVGPCADAISPDEQRLLGRVPEQLTEADVLSILWRTEALVALAWAASIVPELGPPLETRDASRIIAAIPAPWDEPDPFVEGIRLRGDEEVARERERAELWLWRALIDEELQQAPDHQRDELAALIRETASEAAAAGLIPAARDDFSLENRPFAKLNLETKAITVEVALQRLHALNWLCGYGDSWDTVPLEL